MKIFLKHILRTIRNAPFQSIIILLTVSLSVSVAVTAFRMNDVIRDHVDSITGVNTELGEAVITLRSDSQVRLLFEEDAEQVIGEKGTAFGEYVMTVFYEKEGQKKPVAASALDLEQADGYYPFDFTEYDGFSLENLSSSCIISEEFAKEYDIRVGDTVTFRVFNQDSEWRVGAVARADGFLQERNILLEMRGVLRLLASENPLVASLGDAFAPSNRVYVRVAEESNASEVVEMLQASEFFADQNVTETRNEAEYQSKLLLEVLSIWMIAFFLTLLSGMLIVGSLKLLSKQRSGEYARFSVCGATRGQLGVLQITESLLYAVLSALFGLLLAEPMLYYVCGHFAWQVQRVHLELTDIVFGFVFSILLMAGGTLLMLWRRRKASLEEWLTDDHALKRVSFAQAKVLIFPLVSLLLCVIAVCVTSTGYRYIPCIFLILSVLWTLYTLSPFVIRWSASLGEKILEKARRPLPTLALAFKNLRYHAALTFASRMLAVVFALLIAVLAFGESVSTTLSMADDLLISDFTVVGMPEEALERLRSDEAIAGISKISVFHGVGLDNLSLSGALMMEGDVEACVNDKYLQPSLPCENEVALSVGIAEYLGVEVGDPITLQFSGVLHEFTVSAILPYNSFFLAINSHEIPYEIVAVSIRLTDAVAENGDEVSRVLAMAEGMGATVIGNEALFGTMTATVSGFMALIRDATFAAFVLLIFGGINTFSEVYRARRNERKILRLCGQSTASTLKLSVLEISIILLLAVLLACIFGFLICMAVHYMMISFGFALFI